MVKRSFRAARPWFGLALIAAVALAIAAGPAGTTSAVAAVPNTPAAAGQPLKAPVFAYYYLWWSRSHWLDMLGPNYPVTAAPLPLPATLNPTGCGPVTRYSGNHLTDVPVRLYSQDDPGFLEADVRQAASAGLSGFIVNWSGTGRASQRAADSVYSRRLQTLVGAVHKVNAQGIRFKLWLSYKASARVLPASTVVGDLSYFVATYGHDAAFDRSASPKPTVIWQGSRKYSLAVLQAVSARFRGSVRVVGDERAWSSPRAGYLDGDAYYWSSQNPWTNPQSFAQLRALAAAVKGSGRNPDGTGKVWVAPAAPGYDSVLAGGTPAYRAAAGRPCGRCSGATAQPHPPPGV